METTTHVREIEYTLNSITLNYVIDYLFICESEARFRRTNLALILYTTYPLFTWPGIDLLLNTYLPLLLHVVCERPLVLVESRYLKYFFWRTRCRELVGTPPFTTTLKVVRMRYHNNFLFLLTASANWIISWWIMWCPKNSWTTI